MTAGSLSNPTRPPGGHPAPGNHPGLIWWGALLVMALSGLGLAAASGDAAVIVLAALLVIGVIGLLAISRRDTGTLLTTTVAVLLLVPQPYVLVGPLKSVGSPAVLLGLGVLLFWVSGRVLAGIPARAGHPLRWAVGVYLLSLLTSFAAAANRELLPLEEGGATRGLFPAAAMIGILLLANDGLRGREEIDSLVARVVTITGLAAVIGIVEFVAPAFRYGEVARLPGLTANSEVVAQTRAGFSRVFAAASHPIEYSVVIAAMVPLAVHTARFGRSSTTRLPAQISLVLMLLVLPMPVSRSGFLTLAIGLLIYALSFTLRQLIITAGVALIGVVTFAVAAPGLLGTIRTLFFLGGEDPSIAGRLQDYERIPGLLENSLWLGRGLGTFQPSVYFFLDNQYLAALLGGGVIGLVAFVGLLIVGMSLPLTVWPRLRTGAERSLALSLVASIAGFAAAAATFDELSFRQSAFLLFLFLGCSGALWRCTRDQQTTVTSLPGADSDVERRVRV